MKRIAILGAGGFVGRNLVDHLNGRYEIYPITRNQFSLLNEAAVKNFFDVNAIDVVIHCANQGGSRKTGYTEKTDVIGINLRMFYNIERCLTSSMKLIHFGSGAQYDKSRDLIKISETSIGESIPQDEYGFSKYVLSKYIKINRNIYNPIIFGLFGAYEDYTFKFISNSILKNILRMPIVINQNVLFDYLYMHDFLKITDLIIEHDYIHKEFNITPTQSIDLLSIARLINGCSHYQSDIIVRNEGWNHQYTGSNQRLMENFGLFHFTPYASSINELYQFYLKNLKSIDLDQIRQDQYSIYCKTNEESKGQ